MDRTALIVLTDLMFQPRIEAAARAIGLATRVADSPARAADALAGGAAVAVVDLHAAGFDAPALIRDAKAAGVRVLAYGRHTDTAALRAARAAGADSVVPRSQLVEELPELLRALVDAPAGTV